MWIAGKEALQVSRHPPWHFVVGEGEQNPAELREVLHRARTAQASDPPLHTRFLQTEIGREVRTWDELNRPDSKRLEVRSTESLTIREPEQAGDPP
jgi:hypothetical protein